MRWFWIDKFIEFTPGQRAVSLKCVSLSEEMMHDHFPGFPVFPPTLMIEGMAQTAGMLAGQARDFKENVVLAKIRRAAFTDYAYAGDSLCYEAVVETMDDQALTILGTVKRRSSLAATSDVIGHVDLIMSYVNQSDRAMSLPDYNFVFTSAMKNLLTPCTVTASHQEAGA